MEFSAFTVFHKRNPGGTPSWKIAGDFSLCVTPFFSDEFSSWQQFHGYINFEY